MLEISETNYIYPKKEDIEIVIGDEKQPDFKPRMKIKRWDNEVNFSVGVISDRAGSNIETDGKVEWNDGHGVKARFYDKPLRTEPVIIPDSFRYINLGSIKPDIMERVYEMERHGIEPTIITYTPDADCYVVFGHQPFSDHINKKHNINEVRLLQFGNDSPIMFGNVDTFVFDVQFDSDIYSSEIIYQIINDSLCREFGLHGHGRYYNDKDEKIATLIKSKNHVVGYIRGSVIDREKFLINCNETINTEAGNYKVGCVDNLDGYKFINSFGFNLNIGFLTYNELHYPRIIGDRNIERDIIEIERQESMEQFEFEIELDSEPVDRIVELSIETKGLHFLYQPFDVEVGCYRPENVKGSYAVYHNEKSGNQYKSGKAFHIYRPYVIGCDGLRSWCELKIIGNVMEITVPIGVQYPAVIDPTFGCSPSVPGSSWHNWVNDRMYGSRFTSPGNIDTAQSISIYSKTDKDSFNIKGLIVLYSNLTIISNGIGAASPALSSSTGEWVTSTFGTDPDPANSTNYVLMAINNATVGDTTPLAYDTGTLLQEVRDLSNSYTSPVNPTDIWDGNNKYSIYCTYTETAGEAIPKGRIFTGPFCGPLGGPIQCI